MSDTKAPDMESLLWAEAIAQRHQDLVYNHMRACQETFVTASERLRDAKAAVDAYRERRVAEMIESMSVPPTVVPISFRTGQGDKP